MNDITWIILAVFTIATTVITVFVVPLLKSKKSAEEWNEIVSKAKMVAGWVETAIKAAEIFFKGTGLGSEKNGYVLSFVKTLCEKYGITFETEEVAAKIEEVGQNLGLWGEVKDETDTK